ncbi:MAG: multidrug transporter [Lachnospiraceae bacterium]|nr:multidrug transporter [Lachnospiraceae bacterium]
MDYNEQDWKLFRSRLPDWQEAFMDRLNREYLEILQRDGAASDKFWALHDRVLHDCRNVGVCAEMKRSLLYRNLVVLLLEGAITPEDLDGFSVELKEQVAAAGKQPSDETQEKPAEEALL